MKLRRGPKERGLGEDKIKERQEGEKKKRENLEGNKRREEEGVERRIRTVEEKGEWRKIGGKGEK